MKSKKTNQVSLRNIKREFDVMDTKLTDKVVLWSWFQSKLTQILEGLPCEERKPMTSEELEEVYQLNKKNLSKIEIFESDLERTYEYNKAMQKIKQYRDKWLKEL